MVASLLVLLGTQVAGAERVKIQREKRDSYVATARALGVLGGVSMLTGVGMGLYARMKYREEFAVGHCTNVPGADNPMCDASGYNRTHVARVYGDVGTGFALAGVLATTAAAIAYWKAPRDIVSITPVPEDHGAGLFIAGRF